MQPQSALPAVARRPRRAEFHPVPLRAGTTRSPTALPRPRARHARPLMLCGERGTQPIAFARRHVHPESWARLAWSSLPRRPGHAPRRVLHTRHPAMHRCAGTPPRRPAPAPLPKSSAGQSGHRSSAVLRPLQDNRLGTHRVFATASDRYSDARSRRGSSHNPSLVHDRGAKYSDWSSRSTAPHPDARDGG